MLLNVTLLTRNRESFRPLYQKICDLIKCTRLEMIRALAAVYLDSRRNLFGMEWAEVTQRRPSIHAAIMLGGAVLPIYESSLMAVEVTAMPEMFA